MIFEPAAVLCLTIVTVMVHAVGTFAVLAGLSRVWRIQNETQMPFVALLHILGVVSVLLVLHWIEAAIWAVVYLYIGAMPDFKTSMYFSLTSYTTLGYGDVVLPVEWRLLGPFEGAVGILMFGWSTGVMVATIGRLYGRRLQLSDE